MRNPAQTVAPAVPDRRSREDLARFAISAIVATILAAQALISFTYRGGQTFPIIAYPMYKQVHYEGERLNDYVAYVSADGGEEKAIGPETMEISEWLYQKSITAPIISGNPAPLAAAVAQTACRVGSPQTITIAVYDSGFTIRRDGPVSDPRKLMGSAAFDCSAF